MYMVWFSHTNYFVSLVRGLAGEHGITRGISMYIPKVELIRANMSEDFKGARAVTLSVVAIVAITVHLFAREEVACVACDD